MKILTLLAAASWQPRSWLLRDADRIVTSQATGVLKIVGTGEKTCRIGRVIWLALSRL
jgi:hypothetical protein